jgi:hypothetical protein
VWLQRKKNKTPDSPILRRTFQRFSAATEASFRLLFHSLNALQQFGGAGIDRISVVSIGLGERSEHADGVKQLGFFGSIRDVNVALMRSDQFVDKIRKRAVQSLAADDDELEFRQ